MSEYTEKDKQIIREILSLEKINNRSQHNPNQEMVDKIIAIIKRGVKQ